MTALSTTTKTAPVPVLVNDYLAECRAKGLSLKTIRFSYGYPLLKVFLPWCEREEIASLDALSDRALNRLSSELLDTGGKRGKLKPASVATYLRSIRQFLNWAHAQGEAPKLVVQQVKQGRRLLEVLTEEEVARMVKAARYERDRAIVRLMAESGLRAGEVASLREGDLMEKRLERYVRVRGKGSLEREVPVLPDLMVSLRRVLRERPDSYVGDQVFVSLWARGESRPVSPLTVSGVEQVVRDTAERAKIGRRVYPHLLRHSFATEKLRRGMNPVQLARIMGHSSLVMINDVYSHLNSGDLYQALMDTRKK